MKKISILMLVIFLVGVISIGFAQAPKFKYVGATKCKMCHKGEKNGNIFEIWEKNSHAKAYATLATEESKAIAQKAGIKGDPQQAKECLTCHVTGYDAAADLKDPSLTMEEGVSCEACHGPGSQYKSLKVMKDIAAGTVKGADVGLATPDKTLCVKCHNTKSPTFKEFKFEEAAKKIAHPLPKKG
jgi:hypothetical protein